MSLVFYGEGDAVLPEQVFDLLLTSAGQSDVLGKFLHAGDDARRSRCGQPHHLLLVKLRVLEGCDPLDLVQQRGWQPGLLDEQPLREDAMDFLR
jgi:hypothetical protein